MIGCPLSADTAEPGMLAGDGVHEPDVIGSVFDGVVVSASFSPGVAEPPAAPPPSSDRGVLAVACGGCWDREVL
jgi:hypothetical protein